VWGRGIASLAGRNASAAHADGRAGTLRRFRARRILTLSALFSIGCAAPTAPPSSSPTLAVPAPAAVPAGTSACRLGLPPGAGDATGCTHLAPKLLPLVEAAVTGVRQQDAAAYPQDELGYRVRTEQLDDFFRGVVDRVNAGGQACAHRDGLELAIKSTNAESEQYRFWLSSGHLRLGDEAYRATCVPAWF
jgi:hypothetical protein